MKKRSLSLALIGLFFATQHATSFAATASDFKIIDLPLLNSSRDDIATKVLKWDGLVKTEEFPDMMATDIMDATVQALRAKNDKLRMPTIHRFYPRSLLKEVYRIDFRYQDNETFSSLRILYRAYEPEYSNKPIGTDIDSILNQLTPMIGTPQFRFRRTVPGLATYNAYRWEDDAMTIMLDRESQHPGRPAMLIVRLKNTDLANNYKP